MPRPAGCGGNSKGTIQKSFFEHIINIATGGGPYYGSPPLKRRKH
jgi:hypothetical protein